VWPVPRLTQCDKTPLLLARAFGFCGQEKGPGDEEVCCFSKILASQHLYSPGHSSLTKCTTGAPIGASTKPFTCGLTSRS
jgi:hypothetical protein